MPAPIGNQYAKDSGEGRPSEFKEEYIQDVFAYINECLEKNTRKDENGNLTDFELPTIEGFANRIKKTKQTLYNWGAINKDFFDSLEYLKNTQFIQLINGSLVGRLNSTISKLMLSSNHDMREKSDVTTAGKEIMERPTTFVVRSFKKEDNVAE